MSRHKSWIGFALILVASVLTSVTLESQVKKTTPEGPQIKKGESQLKKTSSKPLQPFNSKRPKIVDDLPPKPQAQSSTCTIDGRSIITTVAGNGRGGFLGDGGPAVQAQLSYPCGIDFDSNGNLFIADFANQRIRKVDVNGRITTVAGSGTRGFSGDGGPAVSAAFDGPVEVTVDASGNLYISDYVNNRIRKVDWSRRITTVAGNGALVGFSGDGGLATSATLHGPSSVAIDDSGNLYIADKTHSRIRKVDVNGMITTVAGNGSTYFSGDGGPAVDTGISNPSSVAVDASGNLYISEYANHRIRKVDRNGTITTVAGNGTNVFSGDGGPAVNAGISHPNAIALDDSGNLYIADFENHRIRKVDRNGTITTVAGNGTNVFSGDGGPAANAGIGSPSGIAIDASGNLYIADSANHRIRKMTCSAPLPACSDTLKILVKNARHPLPCLQCVGDNAEPTPVADGTRCSSGCVCRQGECVNPSYGNESCFEVYY